jgi:geranylgeranylglycerol-phosphate geranylgeranyltransferase
MIVAMVLAGIFFGNPQTAPLLYLKAAIVAIAYTGIAMIHNDILDIEIDKINAPDRVLPAGRVTKKEAFIYMFILFVIGTVTGFFLSWESIPIMLLTLILSLLYNSKLKKFGFVGNVTVGLTATSAFLYGEAVANKWDNFWPILNWNASIYLFLISAFLNTGREVCKGIMDTEGDSKYGVRTIAVLYGKKTASIFVLVLTLIALILTFIPIYLTIFGPVFYIAVLAFIILFLFIGIPLIKEPEYNNAKRYKDKLHPLMLMTLVLIIIDIIIQNIGWYDYLPWFGS